MARRPPPERPNLLGDLMREIVEDARSKLIDEAWFGRPGAPDTDPRAFYGREPPPSEAGHDRFAAKPRTQTEEPEIER